MSSTCLSKTMAIERVVSGRVPPFAKLGLVSRNVGAVCEFCHSEPHRRGGIWVGAALLSMIVELSQDFSFPSPSPSPLGRYDADRPHDLSLRADSQRHWDSKRP